MVDLVREAVRSLRLHRLRATLSALGIVCGVMSFVATQRSREIGLRVALGATRRDAVWLVLRDALMMIAAGVAVALPAVWALRRVVETQLFGVQPMDPVVLTLVTGVLGVVALLACAVPARRAARIDPLIALADQ